MSISSKQIGWSNESNLLYEILKGLNRLTGVIASSGGSGGGTVTSVSGTLNRITSTGGTTPVIDISSSYVGQSSITTVGTLTGGATGAGFTIALTTSTVSGTLLVANGGTGLTALGAALQMLRVNAGATALEYFTSTFWNITGSTTITTPTIVGNPLFEGSVIIGPTGAVLTANTRLDIWGQGTTTANIIRLATSGNSVRFTVTDNGVFTFTSTARSNAFSTTWTATGDNQASILFNGTITAANTTAHTLSFLQSGHVIVTGNTNQNLISNNNAITFTTNHTGATVIGYNYNPTLNGSQSASVHLAYRAVTGNMLIGGTTLTTSAILDLQSTTRAFIPPRMTTTQRDAIATPSAGMVVYNTSTNKLNVYTTAWEAVTSS